MPAFPRRERVPAAPPDSRFSNLDALRGIAALSVALFHFSGELPALQATGVFSKGWTGVEIFFVISGFILPCALQSRGAYRFPRHYPLFLWKRTLRLHPPYLAAAALILSVWYLSARLTGEAWLQGFGWRDAAAHPFLLNDLLGLKWVSDVFWTLAIEFQFYLLIGAIFPLLMHARWWLAAVAVLILGGLLDVPNQWIVRYLPVFALGILAWKGTRGGASPIVVAAGAVAAVLAAIKAVGIWGAGVSLAAALAVMFWRRGVPRWLIAAGAVSYSLYLLHASVGNRLLQFFQRRFELKSLPAEILAMAAALAASLAAAGLLYYLVERPALRWSSARKFTP